MNRSAENSLYFVLVLIMVGQGVVMVSAPLGQALFLVGNLIAVWRDFVLGRPLSDKVRSVALTGLTITLLVLSLWPKG